MRRLAASALALLLVSMMPAPAGAEGSTIVWDSDRVVDDAVVVYDNETLVIRGGVNITFRPGDDGGNGTLPALGVMGGLLINGTADRPVRFSADAGLWENGSEPDCLNVFNDGRADRLSVRNASFTDMVIRLFFSRGEFSDCVFDRCDLDLFHSPVSFVNCTFIFSRVGSGDVVSADSGSPAVSLSGCRFDGRNASSHPPPPYDTGDPESNYGRTAIELWGPVAVRDCSIFGYEAGMAASLNSTFIQNSTVRDCGQGILLEGFSAGDSAEMRGCVVEGCAGFGIFALGGLRLQDSVVRDCAEAGVYSYGPLLLANCTVERCGTGVALNAGNPSSPPDWLLLGNRILGCAGYAVRANGQDVDVSGNRFEDGSVTNGLGRLLVSMSVRLDVVDPTGRALTGTSLLEWTNAQGLSGSETLYPSERVPFDLYSIDGAGARSEFFPYSLRVSRGVIENRTVLPAGVDSFTVVLPILPDVAAVHLETDFENIRFGQDIRFLVRVENAGSGASRECAVAFLVDGLEVDRARVPALAQRGAASVYSHPWKASAGNHTLEARLDPAREVPDGNRTNNNMSIRFEVGEPSGSYFSSLGGSGVLLILLVVVVLVTVLAYGAAFMRIVQRRRKRREALSGTETAIAEPRPATIPGETKAAVIKCPKCLTVADVKDPARPLEIECATCRARLRLMK